MRKESMVSRETVVKISEKLKIEAIKMVNYDLSRIPLYRDFFETLLKDKIISEEFDENKWIMDDDGSNITFNFSTKYDKLIIPLKCYVIEKKINKIDTTSIQTNLNYIRIAMELTQGFTTNVQGLEEYLAAQGYRKKAKVAIAVIEFLTFFDPYSYEEIVSVCSQFNSSAERKARTLPNFYDVLLFDDVVQNFYSTSAKDEKLKYYPIFLWWKITKLIPLRPKEFYLIKWDCLSEKEDTYWLTVPREKQDPKSNEELPVTDTIQINKEMYSFIEDYKNQTKEFNNTPYLLSYKLYKAYFKLHESRVKRINGSKFNVILREFYKSIVETRYNHTNMAHISPGDTRHFAFCNMMLQGFNMLSIARIGGHKTLNQQLHYHSHLDHFAESAVTILAKNRKHKFKLNSTFTLDKQVELRSKIYGEHDFDELYKVDFGYCTNHPLRCKVGDCRFCEFYLFSPPETREKEGLHWLRDHSDILGNRIKEQISYMKSLSKNMDYNLKTLQYPLNMQEQLSSNANGLKRLMDQKSMVDSLIMGVENE